MEQDCSNLTIKDATPCWAARGAKTESEKFSLTQMDSQVGSGGRDLQQQEARPRLPSKTAAACAQKAR